MPLFLEWSTMSFIERIVVGPGCDTSISQVSEFMDMNTVFTVWTKALNRTCNFNGSCCVILTERNDTSNFWVVWVQYANSIPCGLWCLWFVHEVWNWSGGTGKSQTEFSQHSIFDYVYKMVLRYYNWWPQFIIIIVFLWWIGPKYSKTLDSSRWSQPHSVGTFM